MPTPALEAHSVAAIRMGPSTGASPARRRALLLALAFVACLAEHAAAYEVEADSVGNTVYVLLLNEQPSASFDSVSISENLPGFVPTASASIVPVSVPAQGSDLAAVDFDVAAAVALGSTGDLTLTVSGSAAGQPIELILTVPLTVVATAPVAQGVLGQGVPAPDPGGEDTDGDGVSDALEIAFGSDPNNASSLPGDPPAVPALDGVGLAGLTGLLVLVTVWLAARHAWGRSW